MFVFCNIHRRETKSFWILRTKMKGVTMKKKTQRFFNVGNIKKLTGLTLAFVLSCSAVVNTSHASIPLGTPEVQTERVQVKYDVKFLDFETGENITGYTVTKVDFAGNTVYETAEEFEGYVLNACPSTKELVLKEGERQTIAFYYTKLTSVPAQNELILEQKDVVQAIKDLKWLSDDEKAVYINEVNKATTLEKIHSILEEAKGENHAAIPQVKYDVKFVEKGTDKDLQGYATTKIDFAGNTVVETAEEFEGYTVVGDPTQELLLTDGENTIVFYYTENSTRQTATVSDADEYMAEDPAGDAVEVAEEKVLKASVAEEKVQVKYDVKFVDFKTGENIKGYTVTKLDFAGNTVVETAEEFEGYVLNACPSTKELVLKEGERQTIVFYYTRVEEIPAESELSIAKKETTEGINALKWLKEEEKNAYIEKVKKAKTVEAVRALLEEAKAENHAAIPQVKYLYKCTDSDQNEFYSIAKIDFADNTVVEKAYVDSDYILLSEKEQELTLEDGKENVVEFKYVAKALMIRELEALKYLGDDREVLLEELDRLSGEAEVEAFLAKAAKINRENAPRVKYTLRYIDADNGDVVKTSEEVEGVVEDVLELEIVEGYAFSSPADGRYKLTEEDNREIVIELVKFNDEEEIDRFLAKGINYDSKLVYKNTNFTGREQELIDYVTKAVSIEIYM